MNIQVLITFIVLSLSLSCAQKESNTPLKVSVGAIAGSSVFTGGLIISGKSTAGAKFVKLVGASDELFLEIPNGNWTFTAIGWDGSDAFEGDSFCDFKSNINLAGEQVNLNMSVTSTKCGEAHYGGYTVAQGFNPIIFNSCTDIKKYLLEKGSQAAPAGMICDGYNGQPFEGTAQSFKLSIPENIFSANGSPQFLGEIASKCYNATTARAITNIRVPWGSSNFHIPYIVKSYPSASCTGNPITYEYRLGLKDLAHDSLAGATPNNSSMNMELFLDVAKCTGVQATTQPFAAGSTTANKYLICSAAQLVNIAKATCPANTLNMGCEAGATYELGLNINLSDITNPTSNAYVMDTLKGQFFGNGFTISNGVRPLFNAIENPTSSSNDQHEFIDVILSNFNLAFSPSAADDDIGIFANTINHTGSMADIRIENIIIDSSSSLTVNILAGTGAYGGLIGQVNHSGSNHWVEIRHNQQLANVSTTSTNGAHSLAGLIGESIGPFTDDYGVKLELNTVGVTHDNLENDNLKISITGQQKIGGLIGKMTSTKIQFGNYVKASITADTQAGGIVGYIDPNSNADIISSYADIDYSPSANPSSNIGGLVGEIDDYANVDINGSTSSFLINGSANIVNNVGGLVGELTSSTTSNLKINNSRAKIETFANGGYYGGLIGNFNPTSPSGALTIENSVAQGTISNYNNTASASNIYRGGLVGQGKNLKVQRSISNVNITGDSIIGGAVGSSDLSQLEEVFINGTLTANSSIAAYIGGAIGQATIYINQGTGKEAIISSKMDTTIIIPNGSGDCTTRYCGSSVGWLHERNANGNTSYFADGIISKSTTTINGTSDNEVCGYIGGTTNAACDSSTYLADNFSNYIEVDNTCTGTGTAPFEIVSSICTPTFEKRWKEFGYDSTVAGNEYYLAGSEIEPFIISTPNQWNAIVDDAFLMNKSFELEADINFLDYAISDNFIPIGRSGQEFKGRIIPNGKKLLNPRRDFTGTNYCGVTGLPGSPTSNNCGLFGYTQDASIGYEHDPLIIENPDFDFQTVTTGGIIGFAKSSRLNIRVIDANYTNAGSASTNIGGIVGQIDNSVSIEASSFEGALDTANATNVGGFVGLVSDDTGDLKINDSYLELSKIKAATSAGGFIGLLAQTTQPAASIDNSYLIFNLGSASDINLTLFGGVTGDLQTGYTIGFTNSFIDYTNLDDVGVTVASIMPFTNGISAGEVDIQDSGTDSSAIIGTTGALIYVSVNVATITESSQADLAANHDSIFRTDDTMSGWFLDSNNNLRLYWEQ